MQRVAGWSLVFVFAAQLLPLWPLPHEVAVKRIEFWGNAKVQWERTDPAKSENPEWTAKAKSESLTVINRTFSDTGIIFIDARMEWAMCLTSALIALSAGLAALRGSSHWRWLSIASLALFFAVQQPWHFFRFFLSEGQVDVGRGLQQLTWVARDFPGTFGAMLLLSVVVPIVIATVVTYAVAQFVRRRPHAL